VTYKLPSWMQVIKNDLPNKTIWSVLK